MITLPSKNKQAFSLIELSISLTIISILIGSILVGKNIRDNAMLHSIIEDMNKLSFAYHGFKLMYLEAPGDFDHATTQFAPILGINIGNGNNNGYIDNFNAENVLALQHLSLAGYIQGNFCQDWMLYSSPPCLNYMQSRTLKGGDGYYFASASTGNTSPPPSSSNPFTVFNNNTNNAYHNMIVYAKLLATNSSSYNIASLSSNDISNSVLTPLEMYNIDNKYDDGCPVTGNIIAADGLDSPLPGCLSYSVSSNCLISYNTSSNNSACYFANILNN